MLRVPQGRSATAWSWTSTPPCAWTSRSQVGAAHRGRSTVVPETPPLQTDRADTGRIIESKQITEMPLAFNRNFQGLWSPCRGPPRPFPPALPVLQLAGQPVDQRQRPVAPGQQRDARRHRQQPQDGPAHRAHPVRGRDRGREREHEQLRRRVRPRGRRGHQRHPQVRHQPAQGRRLLLRQRRRPRWPRTTSPGTEGADTSYKQFGVALGGPDRRRTSSSSSPTTRARGTTSGSVNRAQHPARRLPQRRLQHGHHHHLRPRHRQPRRDGAPALPRQHHPRQPHQPRSPATSSPSCPRRTSPARPRPEQLRVPQRARRRRRRRPTSSSTYQARAPGQPRLPVQLPAAGGVRSRHLRRSTAAPRTAASRGRAPTRPSARP